MRRVYFGLLVSVMFLANFVEIALPKYTALYWQNDVFVNPPYQEFGPAPCVGTEFTITIEVYEAAELYGFDIQFTWNPTWLEYVGYTVMVPVDEHPSGVLHPPTLRVKDVVDEDGNIPDADAET